MKPTLLSNNEKYVDANQIPCLPSVVLYELNDILELANYSNL